MLSLILYCGLISFVVSDTSDDGDKLNIRTTLSALPSTTISVSTNYQTTKSNSKKFNYDCSNPKSTTIPVSKKCIVEMTESEISQIVDRFNSNVVNVVDIHVSSGTSHDKYLLSDFHVSLMNPIGREILHTLDKWQFRYFPWTLNAGIQNVKLHFKENQNECIKRIENVTNFALENTQNIIRSINLATNYEVCSSYKETSSGKVKRTCCQITKSNSTKFNDGCSEPKSFLYGSSGLWNVIFAVMVLFSLFYLMWY